jgi:hypothetical protein
LVNRVDWRDERYARFYEVVDTLVEEILDVTWEDGKKKRRLKGDQLTKLRYSVETLVRDCVAVVDLGIGPVQTPTEALEAI